MICGTRPGVSTRVSYGSNLDQRGRQPYEWVAELGSRFIAPPKFRMSELAASCRSVARKRFCKNHAVHRFSVGNSFALGNQTFRRGNVKKSYEVLPIGPAGRV